jgi:hypothetical protein
MNDSVKGRCSAVAIRSLYADTGKAMGIGMLKKALMAWIIHSF